MNNRKITMYDIIGVGFMAALVFVASQISIPIPSILGLTRIHLGNAFCLLSASSSADSGAAWRPASARCCSIS